MSKIERSQLAEVRNPVLKLRAVRKLLSLPPEVLILLAEFLGELRESSLELAEKSWRKHKAPMATYWKVVRVYSGHLARAIRRELKERERKAA